MVHINKTFYFCSHSILVHIKVQCCATLDTKNIDWQLACSPVPLYMHPIMLSSRAISSFWLKSRSLAASTAKSKPTILLVVAIVPHPLWKTQINTFIRANTMVITNVIDSICNRYILTLCEVQKTTNTCPCACHKGDYSRDMNCPIPLAHYRLVLSACREAYALGQLGTGLS